MIKTKISVLIFIWSALLFFLNLQYNLRDEFDIAIFWASILLMFGTITFQIFYLKNYKFILFEIFTFYFFLHLIYQIGGYGLRGSDSYIDYNFLKTILNNHSFSLGQEIDRFHVNGWPMIHLFSSIVSLITKINPLLIAKFLPSFISSIIVLPLYLLILTIYKNKKVALFSCLLFGSIPQFVSFDGLFVRETFGIFIFILFFYIMYVSKQRKDYRFSLLSIILFPLVILGHHFTSFMLIIFLAIYTIVSKTIPYVYHKYKNLQFSKININMIFLIILVALLAYWFYIAVFILENFFEIFYEVTGVKDLVSYAEQAKLGTPIITLRGKIIYYGFFFFQGSLSLILLIKLIIKKSMQKIEDVTFTIFLYFCLFYGFLALFVLGSLLFPDRFLSFGWMFGLIPLTGLIIVLKKDMYRKILVVLLISFAVFNLYNIDSEYYTGNAPIIGAVATEKDYLIAEQINFPDEYYGYGGVVGAIYDIQGIEQRSGGKNIEQIVDFYNSSTMAVINEGAYSNILKNLKEKSKEDYADLIKILSYKNDKDIGKICDFGNIYILIGGKIK